MAKAVEGIYNTYSKELKLFDVDGKLSYKNRYNGLLRYVTAIRENFANTFIKTVANTPGMRYYMLTHTTFSMDDVRSSDWFVKFMMKYLEPKESDIQYGKMMDQDMSEILSEDGVSNDIINSLLDFNCVLAHPYDDEVILKFGLWNRSEDGRVQRPITFSDSIDEPYKVTRTVDVKKILDEAGLLHLATGEIVIAADIVE